jgi:hypothetical protein
MGHPESSPSDRHPCLRCWLCQLLLVKMISTPGGQRSKASVSGTSKHGCSMLAHLRTSRRTLTRSMLTDGLNA